MKHWSIVAVLMLVIAVAGFAPAAAFAVPAAGGEALAAGSAAPAAATGAKADAPAGLVAPQSDERLQTVGVEVSYDQTEARSMIVKINEFRTGEYIDGGKSQVWAYGQNGSVDTESYANLEELAYDYELEKVAMQRAAEIALMFEHTRPNGSDCFSAIPSGYTASGENIAAGYGNSGSVTAQGAFDSWCETNYGYARQGHRRNMLGAGFNRVGIGHVIVHWKGRLEDGTRPYDYSTDVHYWVQVFGYRTDDLGLQATDAQDDSSARSVDVEVSSSCVESVAIASKVSSMAVEYGDTIPFDGVSCQMRLQSTWPAKFNMTWDDGATSEGAYSVPIAGSYDLRSENDAIVQIAEGSLIGKAVGETNVVASLPSGSGTEAVIPVTVKAKDLAGATVSLDADRFTYDGTAKEPGVTVALDGHDLAYGSDYKVSYAKNVSAGTSATVTVTGQGNYTGTKVATFTIAPATVALPSAETGLTYTGRPQVGVPEAPGYTVTGGQATNAGSYTAVAVLSDKVNHVWADGTKADKRIAWSVARAKCPAVVKAKAPAVKLSKVKRANQVIAAAKAFSVTKNTGKGKVTYKKLSGDKKVSVAANGKVTVKKGAKKGTHSVKVKVSVAAKGNYAALTKNVTLKVKVK